MYTERVKSAIAILILCSAAALKLCFPCEAEEVRQRAAELLEGAQYYREYVIGIGTRLSKADPGENLETALKRIEILLTDLSESEK